MKKVLSIWIIVLAVTSVFAQKEVPTPDQIAQFYKTKTLIVLDDNPMMSFNFKMKEAIQKVWKATDYDFISKEEYETKRMSDKYSFISLDKVWFTKDKLKANYNFLCLSLGGNYKNEKDMPQLCTVPVSYFGVDEESYIYKFSALLQITQDHVKMIKDNPTVNKINVIHQYNKHAGEIKNKTLYITKEDLSREINTEAKFKKVYPYPFKFVSRDELEKIIDNKTPNGIFLHKVGPEGTKRKARCWKTMIGTDDAKLYYFNYHMISWKKPDGLLAKDLKKIAKAK